MTWRYGRLGQMNGLRLAHALIAQIFRLEGPISDLDMKKAVERNTCIP